jgi:DNA-binding winged helix-turn-helix (wHTH) protein/Tfp pilus assembly protein PilF
MNQSSQLWVSHDLTIDLYQQTVARSGTSLPLPHLSFQLLKVLVVSAPDVVSVDDLIRQVWDNRTVSDETVTQRVALLRKALQDPTTEKTDYIQSVRGQGYRWLPAVQQQRLSQQTGGLPVRWLLLAVSLAVVVAGGGWWMYHDKAQPEAEQRQSLMPPVEYTTQGWQYLDKHDANSTELAIELFRKALVADTADVNALTGLSIALSHQVTKFNQSAGLLVEARQQAELAIELDPEHAQAWAALAFVDDASGEVEQAIKGYEKAISLNPENTSTISSLAYLYGVKGRLAEALQLNASLLGSQQLYLHVQMAQVLDLLGFEAVAEIWYQRADELSPDNVFATHQMARFLLSQGRFAEAGRVVDAAIDRGIRRPELWVVAGIIAWLGQDISAAEHAFQQATEMDPEDVEAQLWLFLLNNDPESTDPQSWRAFAGQWFNAAEQWPDTVVHQALLYAYFNQRDQAVAVLQRATDLGYTNHQWLQYLPVLQRTSQWPEWLALIDDMQQRVGRQRQAVLAADWLPKDLLDPQAY